MRYIIDRFEGRLAVCENEQKEMTDIDRNLLPPDVRAGDIIIEERGVYSLDSEATEARKRTVRKKMMDLFD